MNIERMLEESYCPERILQLLMNCVLAGMNFVFGGEPGAGKTECAKFFMQFIPREERVITIEDSLEIHYRDINPGADAVELRVGEDFSYTDAIKASLRQNPKWLVLSEARSVEVTSLLEQWSTGVSGFTTIHLDDVRKLPDRIQNMMSDARDAERMENRIYRYVNVGILIRCVRQPDGKIRRYMDQLCFYSREQYENRIYMILEDGELLSEELPPAIGETPWTGGNRGSVLLRTLAEIQERGKIDEKRRTVGETAAVESEKSAARSACVRLSFFMEDASYGGDSRSGWNRWDWNGVSAKTAVFGRGAFDSVFRIPGTDT